MKKNSHNIAMSILASGAIRPTVEVDYIGKLKGIDSVVLGANNMHILETKNLLEKNILRLHDSCASFGGQ